MADRNPIFYAPKKGPYFQLSDFNIPLSEDKGMIFCLSFNTWVLAYNLVSFYGGWRNRFSNNLKADMPMGLTDHEWENIIVPIYEKALEELGMGCELEKALKLLLMIHSDLTGEKVNLNLEDPNHILNSKGIYTSISNIAGRVAPPSRNVEQAIRDLCACMPNIQCPDVTVNVPEPNITVNVPEIPVQVDVNNPITVSNPVTVNVPDIPVVVNNPITVNNPVEVNVPPIEIPIPVPLPIELPTPIPIEMPVPIPINIPQPVPIQVPTLPIPIDITNPPIEIPNPLPIQITAPIPIPISVPPITIVNPQPTWQPIEIPNWYPRPILKPSPIELDGVPNGFPDLESYLQYKCVACNFVLDGLLEWLGLIAGTGVVIWAVGKAVASWGAAQASSALTTTTSGWIATGLAAEAEVLAIPATTTIPASKLVLDLGPQFYVWSMETAGAEIGAATAFTALAYAAVALLATGLTVSLFVYFDRMREWISANKQMIVCMLKNSTSTEEAKSLLVDVLSQAFTAQVIDSEHTIIAPAINLFYSTINSMIITTSSVSKIFSRYDPLTHTDYTGSVACTTCEEGGGGDGLVKLGTYCSVVNGRLISGDMNSTFIVESTPTNFLCDPNNPVQAILLSRTSLYFCVHFEFELLDLGEQDHLANSAVICNGAPVNIDPWNMASIDAISVHIIGKWSATSPFRLRVTVSQI